MLKHLYSAPGGYSLLRYSLLWLSFKYPANFDQGWAIYRPHCHFSTREAVSSQRERQGILYGVQTYTNGYKQYYQCCPVCRASNAGHIGLSTIFYRATRERGHIWLLSLINYFVITYCYVVYLIFILYLSSPDYWEWITSATTNKPPNKRKYAACTKALALHLCTRIAINLNKIE